METLDVDTPQAPAAPDPKATADAQAAANMKTAQQQAGLNMTNQVTPYGNLTYTQSGTWSDGTPQYTATQTLSPSQQALFDKYTQTQQNLGDIATSQSKKIGDLLSTPFSVDQATQDKIQGLQNNFLDPQWQRNQSALETSLINKGVRPGSEAYTNAMKDFSTQRQNAYDQSYLDSYNTAQQAALTQRNQPINEISALMSGSQVSQPNYVNTPNTGVAPTDIIGAQQQSLNQQNVGYQGALAQQQGLMSGLFGLGSVGLGGWLKSDINAKNIVEIIGHRPDGLTVIDFEYKQGHGPRGLYRGLIAQEVEKLYPNAVNRADDGLLMVNYAEVPRG